MTKPEFAVFAAAMKTYYSKEDRLLPNNQAIELWFDQLEDIPYTIANAALKKWAATNKWSPSISEIREMAADIRYGEIPDWSDGWEQVRRAMREWGHYRPDEALSTMDEITRTCVKRLGFTNLCLSEDDVADRANFRMIYEQEAQRQKMQKQLPPKVRIMIEGLREKNDEKLLEG